MGFECSFNKVKRYKNITLNDFLAVESYINWKNNPWNHQEDRYPDFEKYWNSFNAGFMGPFPGIPDQDVIDFYENIPHGEYGISETIDFWCSQGRYIDDFVMTALADNKVSEYDFEIKDSSFLEKASEWVDNELKTCALTPARITKAFKNNEDGTTTLFPCDGFLFEDDNGNQRMIGTSEEEWGETVFVPSKYFDESKYEMLNSFKNLLVKLAPIDTNEYFVWYSRSF